LKFKAIVVKQLQKFLVGYRTLYISSARLPAD